MAFKVESWPSAFCELKTKHQNTGTGEVAQFLKCFPRKHQDLSILRVRVFKKQWDVMHIPVISVREGEQENP